MGAGTQDTGAGLSVAMQDGWWLNGLVAYYKLDENSGSTANDASGNANTGTWTGTLGSQWTTGRVNSGGNFNGTNNTISIANSTSIQGMATAGTISAWVQFNATSIDTNIHTLIDIAGSGLNGCILFADSGSGAYASMQVGTGATTIQARSLVQPTVSIWYHLVGSWGSFGVSLYINNGLIQTSAGTPSLTIPGTAKLIGNQSGQSRFMSGLVDEVGLWNRALSTVEIGALYQYGNQSFNAL